jgi:hypothetical protein
MTPPEKTVALRIDPALYASAKAQAKSEGMLLKRWLERAVRNELVRAQRKANAVTTDGRRK